MKKISIYPASTIMTLLTWVVTLTVPVALALTAVRIVLNPWYVEFEYRTPNFPADPYGFSFEERLRFAHISLDYLLNDAGIEFLAEVHLPEGQVVPVESCQPPDDCTRLYNARELQHMLDVKNVVKGAVAVWYFSLGLLLVLNVVAWRGGWEPQFRRALALGGWLTLVLIAAILLAVWLYFDWLFILFHRIFFTGDSWLFLRSDSLIRLFPERFWSDTFVMVGGLTAALALATGFITRLGTGELKHSPKED